MMNSDFITQLRDYTMEQMKSGASPEMVSKLVAELMEIQR